MLTDRLHQVQHRIVQACQHANRDPNDVTLLAVSKFHSAEAIAELSAIGQMDFGENYLQEMLGKIHQLANPLLRWHFIGPLQSNKCKEVALYADTLHSLDRLKLVEPLARYRPEQKDPLKVFLQVNIDDEQSKSGVKHWSELATLAEQVLKYDRLQLQGLMAIPAPSHTVEKQRVAFAQLRQLKEKLAEHLAYPLPELSMGMSADLEAAIYEGATIVRIGTDIFGMRVS